MPRRPLIAGNWKMNGLRAALAELDGIRQGYTPSMAKEIDLLIAPPFTVLAEAAGRFAGSGVLTAAQDCHPKPSGAHTGDISAEMIRDAGAAAVILGHSERRADHGESDATVRAKAEAAWRAGLTAIVCVGESRAEREAGRAIEIVRGQIAGSVPDAAALQRTVIAYEPVWAIGTGLTPTRDDVAEVHAAIRAALAERFGESGAETRILYGGSVKPDNAADLLSQPDVDGALIGGASLKSKDFIAIANIYV
jgi:triosephosphate isomerase